MIVTVIRSTENSSQKGEFQSLMLGKRRVIVGLMTSLIKNSPAARARRESEEIRILTLICLEVWHDAILQESKRVSGE